MKFLTKLIALFAGVNRAALGGCSHLVVALVACITVVVCAGVFWRYALNDALAWSEETAKFLMVWLVFIGAPIALARGGHAAIDALPEALPVRFGQIVYMSVYAIVALFVFMLIDQGVQFAWNARVQHTPTTGVSMAVVFAAMPVGGVLMLSVAIEQFLRSIRGIIDPTHAVHASEAAQATMSPE